MRVIATILLMTFTFVGGVMLFGNYMSGISCRNMGAIMRLPVQYSFSTGCMVEYKPGHWVPERNIVVTEIR